MIDPVKRWNPKQGLVMGAVLLIVLGVYVSSLHNPFQYDDIHSILDNPHIRSLGNIPLFFVQPEMFSVHPQSAMYRPLVLVSYALNYALGEYGVIYYHATNLLVHCGNSLLVFFLLRTFGVGALGRIVGTLLFGLHPVNSEAVNYISSRSESLCAFFFLLAFLCYRRGTAGEYGYSPFLPAGVVCFAGAMLSKSVGITFIGVLLWYELLRIGEGRTLLRIIKWQWPFWLVGMVYLYYTRRLVETALLEEPLRGSVVQLLTQMKALVYYLQLLLFPVKLNVEHQFILADGIAQGPVLASMLFITSLLFWLLKGNRAVDRRFWVGWVGLALIPTLLIPLNVLVNEHRLYLPMAAFAVLAGLSFGRLVEMGPRRIVIAAIASLLLFGLIDRQRIQVWSSIEKLWLDSLEKSPLMPRPHIHVGDFHRANNRNEDALREYGKALSVYPRMLSGADMLVAYNNIGSTYLAMGRFAEATQAYQRALQVDSTYAKAKVSLDGLLALQADDRDPMAEKLRKQGLNLLLSNRFDEAEARLRMSLNLHNDLQTWMALGLVYERQGDHQAAIGVYEILRKMSSGTRYAETAEEKIRLIRDRQ
jgi:protein O-mannosyl-transferase